MSTKENIEYIKQELSSDEKLLESLLKAERFLKKYKKPLLAVVIIAIVGIVGYSGYEWKKEYDLSEANKIYEHLLANPNDLQSLVKLKEKSPKLWALYLYSQAAKQKDIKALQALSKIDDPIISDLASYHLAAAKAKREDIHNYTLSHEILKDFALLDEAYLLFKEGKISQAKQRLAQVQDEKVKGLYVKLFNHYGIKVNK
ncbi:tetratricopeptide repeat protein [Nitratiruptor sp. YY09-18]|uniref:tetratricopeptide repeat protein n=1 Tax=Nitratiruptor sp. YY09-18 TaxID=2724901 RepID=UPI001916987E|nr:tetratricopeptide repeat protein [Nitratiruptor sp. YY09-18]BCD67826.1 hypothetical protein NitYY0918_C0733 [Nitratiruptor sp. YY09-18]